MSRFQEVFDQNNNLDPAMKTRLKANFDRADADLAAQQAQISANEADIEKKLADHKAASSAHDAAAITYSGPVTGSNVKAAIESVNTRVSTIVASAGNSNTEIVDARPGKDGATHTTLKARLDTMEQRQLDAARQTVAIKHGLQAVTVPQATRFKVRVRGRTLVNLLGNDGNCEKLTPFSSGGTAPTLSTTQKKSGSNSIKIANSGTTSSYFYKDYTYPLDSSKQYMLAGWLYIESRTTGSIPVLDLRDVGTLNQRYTVLGNSSIVGSWQFVYVKIPTANTLAGTGFRLLAGLGSTGDCVAYFDDIRLYEVDAATSAAIGTTITQTTSPSIDEVLPYVDGIKSVTYPALQVVSDNLIPPFTDSRWNSMASTVNIKEPYELEFVSTGAQLFGQIRLPVVPGKQYTLSALGTPWDTANGQRFNYKWIRENGSQISDNTGIRYGEQTKTITAPNDAYFVDLYGYINSLSSGTFTFKNVQLVVGSTAPDVFKPYNESYTYGVTDSAGQPLTLAGDPVTGVYDVLFEDNGAWKKLNRWKTVTLDGALTWAHNTDYVGYKLLRAPISNALVQYPKVTKFDGKVLVNGGSTTGGNNWSTPDGCVTTTDTVYISVADADSGWGETYTPSAAEISAYFYGWRMHDGTGAAYNGTGTKTWEKITDGTGDTTTLPTTTYPGFTPYSLTYQLADERVEVVNVEGALAFGQGGNHVTAFEGVVVREKVTPYIGGGNADINLGTQISSQTQRKIEKILAIYKNGVPDRSWSIIAGGGTFGGNGERANTSASNYDPTAEYTVTYLALDRYAMTANVIDVEAEYATTQKAVQDELVAKLTSVDRTVTVNVRAIAELYKRVKALGG